MATKKLSAHCNITNPLLQGFPVIESIKSFAHACDEVIVVDGHSTDGSLEKIAKIPKVKIIQGHKWEKEFDWSIMGKNLQIGYEVCAGDWAFHFDADYIFHEKEVAKLRATIETESLPAIQVKKINFVLIDECFSKISIPILLNKKQYPALAYGIGKDEKGNKVSTFLRPITKKGKKIDGLYHGDSIYRNTARLCFSDLHVYTYDFTFAVEEQVRKQRGRFERAIARFLDRKPVPEEKVFENFISTMKHRHKMCGGEKVNIFFHSAFIRDKVRNIREDQFGHSGFGFLK